MTIDYENTCQSCFAKFNDNGLLPGQACGWEGEQLSEHPPIDCMVEMRMVIAHEENNEETRE